MLSTILPFLRRFERRTNGLGVSYQNDGDRLGQYQRYLRAYQGYSIRAPIGATTPLSEKRLKFNLNRPIVNLGTTFLAGKPLTWKVGKDAEATEKAKQIWDRSGCERAFMEAARACAIYGDMVAIATSDGEGKARIEFVNPDICNPTFDGSDFSRLVELQIAWEEEDRFGRVTRKMEFYDDSGRTVFVDGEEDVKQRRQLDRIPASWVRNLSLKGHPYGISDLDGLTELNEEYDHVASKRTRIIDYYAGPTIVFPGMKSADLEKDIRTTLFTPTAENKPYFLEWSGDQPDVEKHLDRIRNAIAEVSQVPAVAFGQQDTGGSSLSGVALRILFGPLTAKTHDKQASWGPRLEYLMWLCLRQEGIAAELDDVSVIFPDPVPVDEKAQLEEAQLAVQEGLMSRLTASSRIGIEDPKDEQKQVEKEKRLDRLETLLKAGMALPVAVKLCGFPDAEAEELLRTDFVDAEEQRLEDEARRGAELAGAAAAGAAGTGAVGRGADQSGPPGQPGTG